MALDIQSRTTEYGFGRLYPQAKDGDGCVMSSSYRLGYKWGGYRKNKLAVVIKAAALNELEPLVLRMGSGPFTPNLPGEGLKQKVAALFVWG